jgi:hypothetical protein
MVNSASAPPSLAEKRRLASRTRITAESYDVRIISVLHAVSVLERSKPWIIGGDDREAADTRPA